MDQTLQYLILAILTVFWALCCLHIYAKAKYAAWLAGSTVATCLFFLGTTVIVSFLVSGALLLIPLWLAVIILSVVHLSAAKDVEASVSSQLSSSTQAAFSPETNKQDNSYI